MISHEVSIEQLIADMTPSEMIGQMTQASNEAITPEHVAKYNIGSVLSGGNGNPTPNDPSVWVDMVGSFADAAAGTRLAVPLLYGVDAVHGHSNVRGATVYPHNIGLGAAADPDLVRRIGRATAVEMLATGVHWTFAPTVAVAQDIRWGRTYESYGRDPTLVSSLGAALVEGLHGDDRAFVLACAKHFVGDGGTAWGTAGPPAWERWWDGWGETWQIDQGDARISEEELRSIHLPPYAAAIRAGLMTVMASYSSWNGRKLHAHRGLLTNVLKRELGFTGFVVSDWMAVDQIAPSYEDSVVDAINAGIDLVMVPTDYERFIAVMESATAAGLIPMQRVDDAVRRILRVKVAAGLFEPNRERPPLEVVGSAEHRKLGAEAVRKSAVLLENRGALPVPAGVRSVAVAGRAADDVGLQCGGWTVGWQGGSGPTTPGTTLLDGLRSVDGWDVAYQPAGDFAEGERRHLGIVCIAEEPYAEGPGDCAVPSASDEDRAVFARTRALADKVILVVYSGRPLVIADLVEQSDAVIAAWLPGTEGAALADLLTGAHGFVGRSPQPWPRSAAELDNSTAGSLYPAGHGFTTASELGTPTESVEEM